mgnify:FL=1
MLFQQGLQGLPQGKVALLPVLPGGGGVIYPKPAANPTAQGFSDCALVFHQPPGIGAIIVEGKLRIDRKHGGAVDLVEGGILAIRDNEKHRKQMAELGVEPIDIVVCNLYPFKQTILKEGVSHAEIIENIDIGGPTMILPV